MMNGIDHFFSNKSHIGIFLLRLFVGTRLLYGVFDNVFNWEHMLEFSNFLQHNSIFFPTFSALTSVYLQLICGALLLLGYQTRIACLLLIINFIVALNIHLQTSDSIETMTPTLAMLFGALTLLFTGADTWSADHYCAKRREN